VVAFIDSSDTYQASAKNFGFETSRSRALLFFSQVELGQSRDSVLKMWHSMNRGRLTIHESRSFAESLVVLTPSQFAMNWIVFVEFSGDKVVEVRIRYSGDSSTRPPTAPADRKADN
jgi:hypothetical protein